MAKDDGGPAFPELRHEHDSITRRKFWHNTGGMSLRDWFAGQALNGLLAGREDNFNWYGGEDWFASRSYELTDAMLKERDK